MVMIQHSRTGFDLFPEIHMGKELTLIQKFALKTYHIIDQLDLSTNWDQTKLSAILDENYNQIEYCDVYKNIYSGKKCCIGSYLAFFYGKCVQMPKYKKQPIKYLAYYEDGIHATCDFVKREWNELEEIFHLCGSPRKPFYNQKYGMHPREVWKNLMQYKY